MSKLNTIVYTPFIPEKTFNEDEDTDQQELIFSSPEYAEQLSEQLIQAYLQRLQEQAQGQPQIDPSDIISIDDYSPRTIQIEKKGGVLYAEKGSSVPYSTSIMWDRLAEFEGTAPKIYALGDGHITVGGGIVINVKGNPILDTGIDYRKYGYTWNQEKGDFDQIGWTQDLTPEDAAKLTELKQKVLKKAEGYANKFLGGLTTEQINTLKEQNPGLYAALVSRAWALPIMSRYSDPNFSSGKQKWDIDFSGLHQAVINYVNNPGDITSKYKMLFFYNSSTENPTDQFSGGLSRRMGDQRAWITGMQDYREQAQGLNNVGYYSLYWNPAWGTSKTFEDGTIAVYDPDTKYVEYKTPEGIILSTDPNSARYWNKENADFTSREYFDSDEEWANVNQITAPEEEISMTIDTAAPKTPAIDLSFLQEWISSITDKLKSIGSKSKSKSKKKSFKPKETIPSYGITYTPFLPEESFKQGGTLTNKPEESYQNAIVYTPMIPQPEESPVVQETLEAAEFLNELLNTPISLTDFYQSLQTTTTNPDIEDPDALVDLSRSVESAEGINEEAQMYELLLDRITPVLGVPYLFGGKEWNTGIDCSGFVKKIFDSIGINFAHGSINMYNSTVATKDPKVGDLVFLKGTIAERGPEGISHVGIYLGTNADGTIKVAESCRKGVSINNWDLNNRFYKKHFAGIRTIPNY